MRRVHVDRHHFGSWSHHVVCALLLEVEDPREHRPSGFVKFAARVGLHDQAPKLVRRVGRHVVFHDGVHSKHPGDETRGRIHDNHERCEDPGDDTDHGDRESPRKIGMLASHRSGHDLPDYYMEEDGENEPCCPAHSTQSYRGQRAPDPSGRRRRGASFLLIDRNAQRCFRRGEQRAERHERDYPAQAGREYARPVLDS